MKMMTAPWKNGAIVASGKGLPKSLEKKKPVKARNMRPTI
jgi:hypothetical protein